jgi:long-subunit fatty acid transport protein
MKKILLLLPLAIVLLIPNVSFGQAKVGTAGAQFLEIGVSARAVGMGEAFLGVADDASVLYYNPAALSLLTQKEAMFTHIDYPAEINYEFAGLVLPAPSFAGTFGISFYMLGMDDMAVTGYNSRTGTGQTFTAKDYALGFSYGAGLTDRFSLGLTFKYVAQYIEEERAIGWAADIGTYYDTGFRNFKICMALANFGPDMKFIEEPYPLPIDFRFGTSIDVVNSANSQLTFAAQASHPNDNLEKYNFGLEYWYNSMFALRAGKKFNYDYYDESDEFGGMTFGAGARLMISDYQLALDYAYQDLGWLDSVNRFSLGLKF